MMTLKELNEALRDYGVESYQDGDTVAAVGYAEGNITSTVALNQLTGLVHNCKVLWIELRPYDEAFVPKGHGPLPESKNVEPVLVSWDGEEYW